MFDCVAVHALLLKYLKYYKTLPQRSQRESTELSVASVISVAAFIFLLLMGNSPITNIMSHLATIEFDVLGNLIRAALRHADIAAQCGDA